MCQLHGIKNLIMYIYRSFVGDRQYIELGIEPRIFFDNSERTNNQTLGKTFNRGQTSCMIETVYIKV